MNLLDKVIAKYWFQITISMNFNIYSYHPPTDHYFYNHLSEVRSIAIAQSNFYEGLPKLKWKPKLIYFYGFYTTKEILECKFGF